MKKLLPVSLLLIFSLLLTACAAESRTASGRKLKVVRIDHGIRRAPTYAYRPANER